MLDFSHFRPVLSVVLGIFVSLAIINYLFLTMSGPDAAWTKETINGLAQAETGSWSRIAGIVHATRHEAHPVPLNLVMGQSAAATDVDCGLLEKECIAPSQWFTVSGKYNSFVKMAHTMRPVFRSGLHPRICLLVIDPVFLAGQPAVRTLPDHRRIVTDSRPRAGFPDGKRVWLLENRDYGNTLVQVVSEIARECVMGALGVPVDETYVPDVDLNSDPYHFKGTVSSDAFDKAISFAEYFGDFSADSYHSDGDQAKSLLEMIDGCRNMGAKVVVVIQPTAPKMLSIVPPEAELCLEQIFAKAKQGGPLTVFNMRNTQPPANMHDIFHVNAEGKQSCTREIIRRLKAIYGPMYGAE